MLGSLNAIVLIACLQSKDKEVAKIVSNALKDIIFVHDYFNDISKLSKTNAYAKEIIKSWANTEWLLNKATIPEKIEVVVLKVLSETNIDDLSRTSEAFTYSDILHLCKYLYIK